MRPGQVGLPRSPRSRAMAGKVGVAGGGEEGQGAVPCPQQHAACIRFYLISLDKSPQAPPPTPLRLP